LILYPAIDLRNGNCVRLERGDFRTEVVFNENPLSQARSFEDSGCEWIHIVDLDGALTGNQENRSQILEIRKKTNLKMQIGGGIRDLDTIKFWKNLGIDRVILGTLAVTSPTIVKQALDTFNGGLGLALDVRKDKVATKGWIEDSTQSVFDLAKNFENCGVEVIIFTDIEKDGLMEGLNLEKTKRLADSVTIPIIASGGLNSLDDLKLAKKSIPNLNGIISGKAIYEGKIDAAAAIEILNYA
jgi:phosphoribosylformimino-5-aminoimidazole carboxamide ribotide isomerase